MIRQFKFLVLLFISATIFAQQPPYKLFYEVNVSHGYGYFKSGKNLFINETDPLVPGSKYSIEPKWSLDWPNLPLGVSLTDNFARRFHFKIGLQKQINTSFSASIGFGIGAMTFGIIMSDLYGGNKSIYVLRSIRNYELPVNLIHTNAISKRLFFNQNLGFSFNIPETLNQEDYTYKTISYSPLFLMANIGLEMEYRFRNGSGLGVNFNFSQGFKNIINDKLIYEQQDQNTGEISFGESKVYSNGTHFTIGLRYYIFRFGNKSVSQPRQKKYFNPLLVYSRRAISVPVKVIVDTNYIKFCVWDDQRIDGDSVSVEYKDSIIMYNVNLVKNRQCVQIKVEPNQPNYLVIHAVNEGRIKPNTIQVIIIDRKGEQKINVRCDLKKSAAINLVIE